MNQSKALSIMKAGKNIFLTGSAGAGKTYTLNQYIRYLRARKIMVAITASTGIASTHINGMTIHAWSGLGLKKSISKKELEAIREKKHIKDHIEQTKVLIIDEISMLHRNQLDVLNEILKFIRQNNEPFGGLQIIFCGDFFQLPPVGEAEETNREKFAFMSDAWVQAAPVICYLSEQHRQKGDNLDKILNQIRAGAVDQNSLELLRNASKNILSDAPKLYTHNADVESINAAEMAKLKSSPRFFMEDKKGNPKLLEMLMSNVRTDEKLQLKLGAKVMFIKNNFEKCYINGSIGSVVDFTSEAKPIVELKEGKRIICEKEKWAIEDEKGTALASFEQFPLRAAWAITIHKSQGMTLDAAEIDLNSTFERGQGYVALSRVRSLEGLYLKGFNNMALELDSLAIKADKRFKELSDFAESNLSEEELFAENLLFVKSCGGIDDEQEFKSNLEKLEKGIKLDAPKKEAKKSTYEITRELVDQGLDLEEISVERSVAIGTIIQHLEKIKELYPNTDIYRFRPKGSLLKKVEKAWFEVELEQREGTLNSQGKPLMKAVHEQLKGAVDYNEIRLCSLFF
jgi:ATP-dependent exoDNAse (exonuclease V) alpha subunit